MKIRKKLGILSLLIIASILALIISSYIMISKLSNDIDKNQKISTPLMLESLNFQKDIIQIQQWLTDISATRGYSGFDDGFDEAELYYEDANKVLDNLKNYNVDSVFLKELKMSLDSYYDVGINMANAYIEGGPEEGNIYMEKFDPFAEDMQEKVDILIKSASGDREKNTKNIALNISTLKYMNIVFSLLVLIVTLLSIIIIKKSVLDRLDDFVAKFKNISEGDGDLTTKVDDDSSDELGQVGKYFNDFLKRMHGMMVLIKSMSHDTNNSAQNTSVITDELTLSVSDVASTTNDVAEQAKSQTDAVRKVIDNINQNNTQISIGIKNIRESVTLAENAQELTEKGFNAISKTVSSFELMESDINLSKDEVDILEISVAEIGNAVDTIKKISYQINLLSLNASIEAARAGEHGKGFSVVSNQIGSLSDETKKATEQISSLIEKVQTDTKKTVRSMDLNSKNIISQRHILTEGSAAIEYTKQINSLNSNKIHDISTIFNDIDERLVELSKLCEDMLLGADSTQNSSEGIAAVIEEQLSALEEVSLQMKDMKENSSNLNLKLNEFIV